MRLIDVEHLGRPSVIACFELDGVIVDPGPESSVGTLLDRLTERPKAILLTHIHLDHAGATGALVERWPDLVVHVHARGAPHLIDPTKLVASAERLYGDEMERLWGRIVPVPADRVRVLEGGERIGDFDVVATPGHASHHVCYLHRPTRLALVGDTGGVRTPPSPLVVAPTPPPDIDVEAWHGSLERIRAWRPSSLAITHFGIVEDASRHLDLLGARLDELAERVRTGDAETFIERLRAEIEAGADADTAAATMQAIPPLQQYLGLERYWRKRAERTGGAVQTAK